MPSSSLPAFLSLPRDRRAIGQWLALLLFIAPALLVPYIAEELPRYERQAILDGQWWLLFSGHFTHITTSHLWLNLAAWILLWMYAQGRVPLYLWVIAAVVCSASTGLGLLLFNPEIQWYVGLSGVLHGMLAVVAICCWQQGRDWTAPLLLGAAVIKLVAEQLHGPLPGTSDLAGVPVVTDAHLYGFAGGLLLFPLASYFGNKA